MDDLISRKALLDVLSNASSSWATNSWLARAHWTHAVQLKDNIVRVIENAPAVEAVPKSEYDRVNAERLNLIEMLGQTKPKWIPVTERLPEGKALCITAGGNYRILEWLETFKCWSDPYGIDFQNFKKGYVTHWMPLPEPQKEE